MDMPNGRKTFRIFGKIKSRCGAVGVGANVPTTSASVSAGRPSPFHRAADGMLTTQTIQLSFV
jgi:hypothetical protein